MLTIGSGIEFGQPHRHEGRARELIDLSRFDRIIGSLHTLGVDDEIRAAMTAIADAGLALEMNTRRLAPWMLRWWSECGGELVTFGSDAHVPEALAHDFADAAELLLNCGFRPGAQHSDPWERRRA
ncbi:MAG: hypothetical protein RLZZ608_984 [Actinomycetota bacterium]|jgi:histidinol-phosphatase (PHP family)